MTTRPLHLRVYLTLCHHLPCLVNREDLSATGESKCLHLPCLSPKPPVISASMDVQRLTLCLGLLHPLSSRPSKVMGSPSLIRRLMRTRTTTRPLYLRVYLTLCHHLPCLVNREDLSATGESKCLHLPCLSPKLPVISALMDIQHLTLCLGLLHPLSSGPSKVMGSPGLIWRLMRTRTTTRPLHLRVYLQTLVASCLSSCLAHASMLTLLTVTPNPPPCLTPRMYSAGQPKSTIFIAPNLDFFRTNGHRIRSQTS
jgi:hypothetical protein